jgi:deoxycytidine triphosphate deaminase
VLEDDHLVGRLHYYRMAAVPDRVYGASIGSSYQQQGLALSKQFKRQDVQHNPAHMQSAPALAPA